jgi:hypothetical protein
MRNGTYRAEDYASGGIATFRSFVKFVCRPDAPSDIHWRPQLAVNGADIVPNLKLVRFENFAAELKEVFATELGIDCTFNTQQNKSDENSSMRKSLQYDEELATLVYENYRCDFEFFGYDQDSWKSC